MTLNLDWDKSSGLLPAIVQDARSGAVLMLGYMNREALAATQASGQVTFWSRSKQRLWTKGESSGHFLLVKHIAADCDGDTLLILADPQGPACHLQTATCWGNNAAPSLAEGTAFFAELDAILDARLAQRPAGSYTVKLFDQGLARMAQKVGEEGVELALAAVTQPDGEIVGEAADLFYHVTLLLKAKGLSLSRVAAELKARHGKHAL
jgi:phosphoribosyl-ATP pyrophosphohydrolase/phosphoribosyl-AMP cyclohydrolase